MDTKEGAGALFYCMATNNFLLVKRPTGIWSILGGGIEPGENVKQAIAREVREESGYTKPLNLVHMHTVTFPNGYRYHNYLALVDHEWKPKLNHEHTGYTWTPTFDGFNIHPGLAQAIKHYTNELKKDL